MREALSPVDARFFSASIGHVVTENICNSLSAGATYVRCRASTAA
jgi:acetyl-CoA carboxylase beta subunit